MRKNYYVYILQCADGTFYTGVTNYLNRRFWEHQRGEDPECYTYSRRPLELVYHEMYYEILLAIEVEKKIKGWSGKKKQALINGDWERIKKLSECRNDSHFKNRGLDSARPDKESDPNIS